MFANPSLNLFFNHFSTSRDCFLSTSFLLGVRLDRSEKKKITVKMRKPTFWCSTWSDTNRALQPQKMARGLKFQISKVEGLYSLCRENKGADQLCDYLFAYLCSHKEIQMCHESLHVHFFDDFISF